MKVLFLSTDASIPDVASATRQRMQGYADEIGELHVLMRSNRNQTTEDGSIIIHEIRTGKLLALWRMSRYARMLIHKCGIELVSTQDPFEYGLIGYWATRGTYARLHVQVHTDFLSPWFAHGYTRQALLNHVRVWIAAFVLPRAHGIRVVAPRVKRLILARFGTHIAEPSVIPVLVSIDRLERSEVAHPFPITLLVLGRLEPEKRFQDAIHALAHLRKKHPDAGLIVAGSGSEGARLRHEVHALQLDGWVRFLGERSDVAQLMAASDIFLQTSAYEGYSRTLVEAAYAGLPIVTTDVGIVGDVLKSEVHVLVSHVGDVISLTENIERYLADASYRMQLAHAAQEAVMVHLKAYENQAVMIAHDLRDTISHV